MEEVRWVAGGDNIGDTMIDLGERAQDAGILISSFGAIGKVVGPIVTAGGVFLVKQGKKRNESTDNDPIPGGGGSGGGDPGGTNPGGSGGGSGPLPGGGGGHQSGCGSGDPDCTIIWHPT